MTDFSKLLKQYWQFLAIAAIALVLVTILGATGGDGRQVGSSYSLAPNGYSSWYRMMVERGVQISRWRRSVARLAAADRYAQNTTLLQVTPQLERIQIGSDVKAWVERGNRLVILGTRAPARDIPFSSDVDSSAGKVRIETTRRMTAASRKELGLPATASATALADSSGSIIERFTLERGEIIVATAPYLAANAYVDVRPNYELLAELVGADERQILVDEYIHGYRDRRASTAKAGDRESAAADDPSPVNLFGYLAGTPLAVALVNIGLGAMVLFWQQNRRFGKVTVPQPPAIDNSEAYIQALGSVLQQANSSDFVIQQIGRAKLLAWQQKLGLAADKPLAAATLIQTWQERLRLPAEDLAFVLQLTTGDSTGERLLGQTHAEVSSARFHPLRQRRPTPAELITWLQKIRAIDRQLGG